MLDVSSRWLSAEDTRRDPCLGRRSREEDAEQGGIVEELTSRGMFIAVQDGSRC